MRAKEESEFGCCMNVCTPIYFASVKTISRASAADGGLKTSAVSSLASFGSSENLRLQGRELWYGGGWERHDALARFS
ncbi:protein of unknown function [Hyphomicrobium sp. MC1]|nr:protein of unknown function [Hyphomicrobium sp. MC1]